MAIFKQSELSSNWFGGPLHSAAAPHCQPRLTDGLTVDAGQYFIGAPIISAKVLATKCADRLGFNRGGHWPVSGLLNISNPNH